MRIGVVAFEVFAFELVGCFGLDDGVDVAAVADVTAAGTLAGCGADTCGSGGVASTFCGDEMTVRNLMDGSVGGGTLLGGMLVAGTFLCGIGGGEG